MEKLAKESRIKCLELVYRAQTSHIGSLFSCADLFAVIFSKIDLDKDKFILSAGWKACMLYFHLWKKGRITEEELNSYCQAGSKFIGLAEPVTKDVMIAGGSMGLGFPGAVGLALAKKLKKEEGLVYVLMSDGEMQCGTTWEAALVAAHHQLGNLVVIVDRNNLQAMGKTEEILRINPLGSKWMSFGWHFRSVDGHDYGQIESIMIVPKDQLQPTVVVAETTKGKGVSLWENNNLWHYAQIKEDDYKYALSCLNS